MTYLHVVNNPPHEIKILHGINSFKQTNPVPHKGLWMAYYVSKVASNEMFPKTANDTIRFDIDILTARQGEGIELICLPCSKKWRAARNIPGKSTLAIMPYDALGPAVTRSTCY